MNNGEINKKNRFSTEDALLKVMQTAPGRDLAFLCYYEWDINNAYQRFVNSEEWSAVKRLLSQYQPPSFEALDIGAGNGIGSYALNKSGFSVTSLEPDPSELVGYGALKNYKKIEPLPVISISGHGEYLPFKENTFGLVYMRQTIHHCQDLNKLFLEISRVLMPGGIFLATREHIIDDKDSLNKFLENHALHRYTQSEGAFLLNEYTKTLKSTGFKLIKILFSWDSVINHYPTNNDSVKKEIQSLVKARMGSFGEVLASVPLVENIFRRYKSNNDHSPGRMISFVARAL